MQSRGGTTLAAPDRLRRGCGGILHKFRGLSAVVHITAAGEPCRWAAESMSFPFAL